MKIRENVVIEHNNTWKPATVTAEHHTPRSYVVENEYGQTYRRNRSHLRSTSARFNPDQILDDRSGNATTSTSESTSTSGQQNGTMETTPKQTTTPSGRVVKVPTKFQDYVM